jgi:hypothetical protein
MFKVRSRILTGALALALTTIAPTAVLTAAADASSTSCYLYADTPTWESYSVLAGEGGRLGCSTTRTVTVRLRQDRPWWPDRTLAEVSKTGTNVILVARRYCTGNSDMKVFTETLNGTGGKVQSGRVLVSC